MNTSTDSILDTPLTGAPHPDEFIQAAMRWHFTPDTGSRFWLERIGTLYFDPLHDVKSINDLALFPNVCNELRDVRVEDLIPRGYAQPEIVGISKAAAPLVRRSGWWS
jgi:hypothetical protein